MSATATKKDGPHHAEAIRVTIGILLISGLAPIFMYFLNQIPSMHSDDWLLFLIAIILCATIFPITYYFIIRPIQSLGTVSPWIYLFSFFSFTSSVDLFLAFTIDNFSLLGLFYLKNGEVYLRSAHGCWINYWDGSGHWLYYLFASYHAVAYNSIQFNPHTLPPLSTHSPLFRFFSLAWAGSIANSLFVLLFGAAVGKYGPEIKPSMMLNVPYLIYPILFAFKIINTRSSFLQQYCQLFINQFRSSSSNSDLLAPRRSLLSKIIDGFFIAFFVFATVIAILRTLCVANSPIPFVQYYRNEIEPFLKDPSGFPTVQMWVIVLYFVPFYWMAIYSLIYRDNLPSPSHDYLPDWSAIHAGAAVQAIFSYLGGTFDNDLMFPEPTWKPVSDNMLSVVLGINGLLLIVPVLFYIRTCTGWLSIDFYKHSLKQYLEDAKKK